MMKREQLEPGDLVQLLPGGTRWQEYVGHIYVLNKRCTEYDRPADDQHFWNFDPPVICESGPLLILELHWAEHRLRKINKFGDGEADKHSDRIRSTPGVDVCWM